MTRINTNLIYNPNNPAPTMAQGLQSIAGGMQNIKQARLADIAQQQSVLKLQQAQEQAERQQGFRQDFQDMGYTPGVSDPRELTDLYAEHFPMQVAQQEMQNQMKAGDPYAERKLLLREQAEVRRGEQFGLNKVKAKLYEKRINQAEKRGDFTMAAKLRDEIFREKKYLSDEEDRKWKNDFQFRKGERDYGIRQNELVGQVPSIIRGNYRGRASTENPTGQDLTPENVKTLTTATEGASKILDNTNQLLTLIDKYGLEKLPTSEQARMKTLIGNIALQYKGKDFANLGVLTGPDLDILMSVTGDPTSFSALSSDIQGQKLRQFKSGLISGYNKTLISRGFDPIDPEVLGGMGNAVAPSKLSDDDKAVADSVWNKRRGK